MKLCTVHHAWQKESTVFKRSLLRSLWCFLQYPGVQQ